MDGTRFPAPSTDVAERDYFRYFSGGGTGLFIGAPHFRLTDNLSFIPLVVRRPSSTGGFTGVRCGFTVMSKRLLAQTADGRELPLHQLWHRRWSTKANSVSYPVQRGAEALYSDEGREEVRGLIEHYMGNARILSEAAHAAGMQVYGGKNAPYIWVRTPPGLTSWEMFDRMLQELNVVVTPGSGFGSEGEGYFRISAFNSRENAEEVARRLAEHPFA